MRTSLSETIEIEKYLCNELSPECALVFHARLLIHPGLRKHVFFQRLVHRLVHLYHRRHLTREVEAVHDKLFNDPAETEFRKDLMKIFNP